MRRSGVRFPSAPPPSPVYRVSSPPLASQSSIRSGLCRCRRLQPIGRRAARSGPAWIRIAPDPVPQRTVMRSFKGHRLRTSADGERPGHAPQDRLGRRSSKAEPSAACEWPDERLSSASIRMYSVSHENSETPFKQAGYMSAISFEKFNVLQYKCNNHCNMACRISHKLWTSTDSWRPNT
jgi:hypothetical protein